MSVSQVVDQCVVAVWGMDVLNQVEIDPLREILEQPVNPFACRDSDFEDGLARKAIQIHSLEAILRANIEAMLLQVLVMLLTEQLSVDFFVAGVHLNGLVVEFVEEVWRDGQLGSLVRGESGSIHHELGLGEVGEAYQILEMQGLMPPIFLQQLYQHQDVAKGFAYLTEVEGQQLPAG